MSLLEAAKLLRELGSTDAFADLTATLHDGKLEASGIAEAPLVYGRKRAPVPVGEWERGEIDRKTGDLICRASFMDVEEDISYRHIEVSRQTLLGLLGSKSPATTEPPTTGQAFVDGPTGKSKDQAAPNKGGRPDGYDWTEFIAEVVRIANDDAITSQPELVKHMSEWCQREWGKEPAPSTIRKRVSPLLKRLTFVKPL